jgi:hypothetical protein
MAAVGTGQYTYALQDGGVLYHLASLIAHAPCHESRWRCCDTR